MPSATPRITAREPRSGPRRARATPAGPSSAEAPASPSRPANLGAIPSHDDPLRGYAVHFTRGNHPDAVAKALDAPLPHLPSRTELIQWQNDVDSTGYWSSLSILWQGHIRPTTDPLGVAAEVPEVEVAHRSACFSATGLDKLARLIKTRSLYGVGFTQDVLAAAGGRRVRYLRRGSADAARWAIDIRERQRMGVDPSDPFWRETPFIDPSEDNGWEEEWRVPGGFSFEPDQVAFVFIPGELHEKARAFFEEHRHAGSGPAYVCRYIDPTWDHVHLEQALTSRVPAPPAPERVAPFG